MPSNTYYSRCDVFTIQGLVFFLKLYIVPKCSLPKISYADGGMGSINTQSNSIVFIMQGNDMDM